MPPARPAGRPPARYCSPSYPPSAPRLEERVDRLDFRRVARVPLDFAEEILPAEVEAPSRRRPGPGEPARPSPATEERGGVRGRRRRSTAAARPRRLPHVHQLDEMDCGAACLGMVTRYFGKTVSLPLIRELVHTSTDGTSLLGIARGAEELGPRGALGARVEEHGSTSCRCRPSCTGRATTGSCSTRSRDDHVRVGDPARGRPQAVARRVRREVERLRGAVRVHAGVRRRARGAAELRWLVPFLRPHLRHARQGRGCSRWWPRASSS